MIIQPRFDGAWEFSEGRGTVFNGGKFGYVDNAGSLVVELLFVMSRWIQEHRLIGATEGG